MSTGKVVLGTLAGLAIGAIAGILFAPEKGSVTRKQIMDLGDDFMDDMTSKFGQLSDSIAEKLEGTKKEIEAIAEKGKLKYDESKKDLVNAATDIKHAVT